jgi:succinyl-CoA synthetase beta subunit
VLIARERIHIPVPFIIRLIGTNDALGRSMLLAQGLHAFNDLTEAVKKVIEASKGGGGK